MNEGAAASLLEAVPLPLVLVGADERVAHLNAAARRLFGGGILGRHHVTGLRQPALLECVEGVLKSGVAGKARFPARQAGRDVSWQASVSPIQFPEGIGALITFEDTGAAEEASQMRRDFVANVSHELRTPLTAMLGFIETLQGAAAEDRASRERFLSVMQAEALRMNRLIDGLLSLSRVESEERVRPTTTVDLSLLLDAVVSSMRHRLDQSGVRIARSGELSSLRVAGDADQLFQVFANLVDNAIKYGGDGKEITIGTEWSDRDPVLRASAVRVSVRDDGPGIDTAHVPRITERFYRIDAHRSRELGGAGLGLAIVKHIVNRHRGRLRIQSRIGGGSTFTVILPGEADPESRSG